MGLVISARAVLDAARDDEQLACGQFDVAVAQLNRKAALEHEEEVVGLLVGMPHELAACLDHLQLEVVQVADDPRAERLVELGERSERSPSSVDAEAERTRSDNSNSQPSESS